MCKAVAVVLNRGLSTHLHTFPFQIFISKTIYSFVSTSLLCVGLLHTFPMKYIDMFVTKCKKGSYSFKALYSGSATLTSEPKKKKICILHHLKLGQRSLSRHKKIEKALHYDYSSLWVEAWKHTQCLLLGNSWNPSLKIQPQRAQRDVQRSSGTTTPFTVRFTYLLFVPRTRNETVMQLERRCPTYLSLSLAQFCLLPLLPDPRSHIACRRRFGGRARCSLQLHHKTHQMMREIKQWHTSQWKLIRHHITEMRNYIITMATVRRTARGLAGWQ